MGAYGVLLIAVLVVVSGAIAYIGDIIGRRMGRKRLTIFGLRPRYTAILVSVVAGMLIAGFTLAAAILVSRDVRLGLTKVDYLVRRNAQLRRVVTAADRRIGAQRRQLQAVRRQGEELEREIAAQRKTLGTLGGQLKRSEGNLADRQRKLSAAERRLGEIQRKFAEAERALQRVEGVARRVGAQSIADTRLLKEQQNRLRQEIAELEQTLANLREVRTATLTFEANEELATVVLEEGLARAEVLRRLRLLMSAANTLAQQRGAKGDDNGKTVVLFKSLLGGSDETVLGSLADTYAGAPHGVVVRLVSMGNSFAGEQALVDFLVFNNRLIYHRGDSLAAITVDASMDVGRLSEELVNMLRDRVRLRAGKDGMMPTVRQMDAQGKLVPQEGIGGLSLATLVNLAGRIKELGGQVQVEAIANRDAWTAGPLELDLEVRTASS